MSLPAKLRAAVEKAGGHLEEDTGYHGMRVFQAVAPDGQRWAAGGGLVYLRIEWDATKKSATAENFNATEFQALQSRLALGLEPDPDFEPEPT